MAHAVGGAIRRQQDAREAALGRRSTLRTRATGRPGG
jgi:hypothetical protein